MNDIEHDTTVALDSVSRWNMAAIALWILLAVAMTLLLMGCCHGRCPVDPTLSRGKDIGQ